MSRRADRRAELRAIQDAWLEIPAVQRSIKEKGADVSVFGQGTPTPAQVQRRLFPQWEQWFRNRLMSECPFCGRPFATGDVATGG